MNIGGIKNEWFNYGSYALDGNKKLPVAELKDEYRDEMKAYIDSQIKNYTDYSTDRLELTDEQLKTLKDKYDLDNMSEREYQYFLDDLAAMGAITENEKYALGGASMYCGEFSLTPANLAPHVSICDASKVSESCDVGSQEWLKYRAALETVYFDGMGNTYESNENILFDYVSDIISKAENLDE